MTVQIRIDGDTYRFEYGKARASVCDLKDGRCLIGEVESGGGTDLLIVFRAVKSLVDDRGFRPMVSVSVASPHIEKLRKIYHRMGLVQKYEVYGRPQDVE